MEKQRKKALYLFWSYCPLYWCINATGSITNAETLLQKYSAYKAASAENIKHNSHTFKRSEGLYLFPPLFICIMAVNITQEEEKKS